METASRHARYDRRIDSLALRRAGRTVDGWRPRVVLDDSVFAVPVKRAVTHDAPAWVITHDLVYGRLSSVPDNHPDRESIDRHEGTRQLEIMDVSVAIPAEEARESRELVPHRTVLTVPMPIRSQAHRGATHDRGPMAGVVGARSEYTATGIRGFLNEVWPTVRRRLPAARLDVCGDQGGILSPPPASVRLQGRMPELEPFYERAALTIPDVRRRLADGAADVARQLAPPDVFQESHADMRGLECPLP